MELETVLNQDVSRDSLLARLSEFEWLERVAEAASATANVLQMMANVRDLLMQRFSFDRFGILLGTMDGRYCVIHELVTRTDMQACPEGSLMTVKQTGLEWVFTHQRTHYASNIASNPEFTEDLELAAIGLRSIVRLPLIYNNHTYGVMTVKSMEPERYAPHDLLLLEKVVRKLSVGVHSAKLLRELNETPLRDSLTHVMSRRFFHLVASDPNPKMRFQALSGFFIEEVDDVWLLTFNVNDFRKYNDTYGSLMGDKRLCDMSGILTDAVEKHGLLVRYEDDEFLAILPGADTKELHSMEQDIARRLHRYNQTQTFPVRLRLGAAHGSWRDLKSTHEAALRALARRNREVGGLAL